MTLGRRARLAVETAFALTPGVALTALGLWCIQWAVDHEPHDNERNWVMGTGIALLMFGVVVAVLSVLVMAVYGWREGRENREASVEAD